jgi:hypothetical protein
LIRVPAAAEEKTAARECAPEQQGECEDLRWLPRKHVAAAQIVAMMTESPVIESAYLEARRCSDLAVTVVAADAVQTGRTKVCLCHLRPDPVPSGIEFPNRDHAMKPMVELSEWPEELDVRLCLYLRRMFGWHRVLLCSRTKDRVYTPMKAESLVACLLSSGRRFPHRDFGTMMIPDPTDESAMCMHCSGMRMGWNPAPAEPPRTKTQRKSGRWVGKRLHLSSRTERASSMLFLLMMVMLRHRTHPARIAIGVCFASYLLHPHSALTEQPVDPDIATAADAAEDHRTPQIPLRTVAAALLTQWEELSRACCGQQQQHREGSMRLLLAMPCWTSLVSEIFVFLRRHRREIV